MDVESDDYDLAVLAIWKAFSTSANVASLENAPLALP